RPACRFRLVLSCRGRETLRGTTRVPWTGRRLGWNTSSPPPAYNFASTPQVHDIDARWQMKQHGFQRPQSGFLPVHMPKNTGAGIILAGISTLLGFALIWHMWLLAGASFVALLAVTIGHTFNYKRDYYIPAEEVTRVESERTRMLAEHV